MTRLSKFEATDAEERAEFLTVAREHDPGWWQSVLAQIDVYAASRHWQRALENERAEVRRGAELTLRCLLRDGVQPLRDVMKAVLERAVGKRRRQARRRTRVANDD